MVSFKSGKENFEIRLRDGNAISLDKYYYLDFPVSSKSTLGEKEALVFEAPNSYCDDPACSDPFIAYSTKNGDDFYNLVFSGDAKLSNTEKSILSSFEFTNETANWQTYRNSEYGFEFKYPNEWGKSYLYNVIA